MYSPSLSSLTLLGLVSFLACSEPAEEPGEGLPSGVSGGAFVEEDAGAGGSAGAVGGASDGGAGGLSLAGAGGMTMTGGAAGMTTELDPPEALGPLAVREGCPEITVEPAENQNWAIVALNLLDPELVIQNVSGVPQTLTTDNQWCSFPKYERLLPLDIEDSGDLQLTTFAPGDILRIKLVESDRVEGEQVDRIRFDPTGGEMALYRAPGTYRNTEDIMAFISWGDGNPTEGREAVAAGAYLWSYGSRIEIVPGRGGIVATGTSLEPSGFTSVPLACLPIRQEED